MKYILLLLFVFCFSILSMGQEPKLITDCTVTFDVSVIDMNIDAQLKKALEGSTKIVYIRSNKLRTDLITPSFLQTTLQDSKSDTTIVLREFGNNKYISYLSENKRREQLKKYEGIKFSNTAEKKVILGYECIKTIATLADGSTYNVFYAPSIIASNNSFEVQFKEVPGFILEYESQTEDNKLRVKYTASKISLVPVPIAKFDIPKSGYRVL